MILLFLMFICFGCFGGYFQSNNHRIEEKEEKNKSAFLWNDYYYFGFSDLLQYENMLMFVNNLGQYETNLPYSNPSITYEDFFRNSVPYRITLNLSDVSIGDIDTNGNFVVNTQATNTFEYIEFTYSYNPLDTDASFSINYRYNYQDHVCTGYYYGVHAFWFNAGFNIFNVGTLYINTPVVYESACVKFYKPQFNLIFEGFERGTSSYDSGYQEGFDAGQRQGYINGFNEGSSNNGYPSNIFASIVNVALLPVNVFLTILNFEVFGVNIAGFVTSLLTISIVIIIIRFLLGGKNDS